MLKRTRYTLQQAILTTLTWAILFHKKSTKELFLHWRLQRTSVRRLPFPILRVYLLRLRRPLKSTSLKICKLRKRLQASKRRQLQKLSQQFWSLPSKAEPRMFISNLRRTELVLGIASMVSWAKNYLCQRSFMMRSSRASKFLARWRLMKKEFLKTDDLVSSLESMRLICAYLHCQRFLEKR